MLQHLYDATVVFRFVATSTRPGEGAHDTSWPKREGLFRSDYGNHLVHPGITSDSRQSISELVRVHSKGIDR